MRSVKTVDSTNVSNSSPLSGPRSILRVVQLLHELATSTERQTLTCLSERMDLPKTTLHTMLKVLDGARYVLNDNGEYKLGPNAIRLGAALFQRPSYDFPVCAKPIAEAVRDEIGETVCVVAPTSDRRSGTYLLVLETESWLRFSVKVGAQRPLYATGSGRAILAFMPRGEVNAYLDSTDFVSFTPRTLTSKRAVLAALKEVREKAVSYVEEGTVEGATAVAAPILDYEGKVIASISIAAPANRISARRIDAERTVVNAARDISNMLGYADDYPPKIRWR